MIPRGWIVKLDLVEPSRRKTLAHVPDRRDVFELLERGARRQPEAHTPVGHRFQRLGRTHPRVADDFPALERRLGAFGQLGDEEPRIETAWERRRRHPAGQRHETIRAEAQVEVLRDRRERSGPREQLRPRARDGSAGRGRRAEQDPCLLEQLADGGDVRRMSSTRRQVAAERSGRIGRSHPGSRHEPDVGVVGVDRATREDVDVWGEGHRRWSMRQQDLEAVLIRTHEHHRGRGTRDDRAALSLGDHRIRRRR